MNVDLSLYLVTDRGLCGTRGVPATVAAAVAGGARIVQLRDKHATDAEIVEQLLELSHIIDGRAALLVNDRLEAALTARARGARVDGVHLGQGDVSVQEARERLGRDAIIGLTANTAEHVAAVAALPEGTVDYLGVGVIRPTLTKPDHPPALGVAGFRALAASSALPCVAIGGIARGDVAALRDAGAAGVAVVSALCAAADPRLAAREFRQLWRGSARTPRVLSIAGSDPSGGAGIQADLKAIAANGGYGMAAISALTAQNTRGVRGVHVPPAAFLREQLDAVSDDIQIDAVKIGMLADADVIRTVIAWLDQVRPPNVVVDPVMVATSGDRLLDAEAEAALRELCTRADVVTPNIRELAALTAEAPAAVWDDALSSAQRLSRSLGTTVLVTGGDLPGAAASDGLVDASGATRTFTAPRILTRSTHGTGCSLSAALATQRAHGEDWPEAVSAARAWLRESLSAGADLEVGEGHGPVHHFAGLWRRGGWGTGPTPREIAGDWWQRIAPIRDEIDELPFIRGLADGTLDPVPFRVYLTQDALYLREYARTLAEAARRAPTSPEQAFWAESAHGAIAGELELHASWLTRDGIDAHSYDGGSLPATTSYLDHLRAVAFGGGYPELIAAVLPCFWLYTDLGVRLHAGDFGSYAQDPQHPYASWLATYADPAFAEATATAIAWVSAAAAAADGATRQRMWAAFETSARHEREFFAAPMRGDG